MNKNNHTEKLTKAQRVALRKLQRGYAGLSPDEFMKLCFDAEATSVSAKAGRKKLEKAMGEKR